jgi:hypothetical protein
MSFTIQFSSFTDKYQNLTVHAENDDIMGEFIMLMNAVLLDLSLPTIENIKYTRPIKGNILQDCDWEDMPEFKVNENFLQSVSIILKIEKEKYLFVANLIEKELNIKIRSRSAWYPTRPEKLASSSTTKIYVCNPEMQPKYPIYIISKGRWERRLTSKYLDWINVPYKIVVEPQEYANYAQQIDPSKILILPEEYCNLNQGSIPARNFCLHLSRANGDVRHWILDDNIKSYKRFNNSQKIIMKTGAVFRILEDYVDKYNNIMMAGHNYTMFAITTATHIKAITKNTRIYSSILLHNSIPFEWRGKYNEDTDLSLRILKSGYATALFNNILADKMTTMLEKGGNTDSIYKENGILMKTDSLIEQHPDVTKKVHKFGRVHHLVNYKTFKKNSFGDLNLHVIKNDYKLDLVDKI